MRIVVEINPGEPISGTVSADGQPAGPFVGLMQLVAAIDSARSAPPASAIDEGPGVSPAIG